MTVTPGPIRPHKSNHQSLCRGAVYPRATSFPPEEAPRSIHKGHTSIRKSCKGEKGEGVSRPDTYLAYRLLLDWSRHKRSPLSLPPSLSPSAFLFPSTFAAPPSSRPPPPLRQLQYLLTPLFTFSRSPHNQNRRPTFQVRPGKHLASRLDSLSPKEALCFETGN